MSRKVVNKILLFTGFVSLIHAAFSAAQHRTYLRLTEQDSNNLPIDILMQTLVSLVVVIYNLIQVVADFKEIRAAVDLQGKSWETLSNVPSFYTFNHRGRALHPHYSPPMGGKGDP